MAGALVASECWLHLCDESENFAVRKSYYKAAILRSFAKQSSHDIRNMRGPGAQNDSAFSTASSGERRVRPRVVRRTTLHVWARCLP